MRRKKFFRLPPLRPNIEVVRRTAIHSIVYFGLLAFVGGIFVNSDQKNHIAEIKRTEYFNISTKAKIFNEVIHKMVTSLEIVSSEWNHGYTGRPKDYIANHRHFFTGHERTYDQLIFINLKTREAVAANESHLDEKEIEKIIRFSEKVPVGKILLWYDLFKNKVSSNHYVKLYGLIVLEQTSQIVLLTAPINYLLEKLKSRINDSFGFIYILNDRHDQYLPIFDGMYKLCDVKDDIRSIINDSGVIDKISSSTSGQFITKCGLVTFEDLNQYNTDMLSGKSLSYSLEDLTLFSFVPTKKMHESTFERVKNELRLLLIMALVILIFNYLYNSSSIHNEESQQKLAAQDSQVQTQAQMATLGELTAGIAHEINNPLTILVSATEEILLNAQSDKIAREQLIDDAITAKNTTYRIADVVKGLRSVTRNAENDPFEPSSLKSIIADAVIISRIKLKQSEVKLHIGEVDENILLECRPAQISQTLLNLLGNSIDAIREDEAPWIELRVEDEEYYTNILITDSGHGISPEVSSRLFNQFFTTKKFGEGTGLGLSISKKIVEVHNGTLRYNHNCSNTQFVIRLPKKQPIRSSV